MIEYAIDPDQKLVISRMVGNVSFTELLNWHYELKEQPNYDPSFSGIADMRKAHMLVTPDNIQELVNLNKKHNFVSGKWVCLVDTPVEKVMASIYKDKKASDHAMENFNSEIDASDYLNVDVANALEIFNHPDRVTRSAKR